MKFLLTILLFISVQSFGQSVDVKVKTDSSGGYQLTIGSMFIIDSVQAAMDRIDTIYTNKVLRCQANTNTSLFMTKVKYLLRKKENGVVTILADTGKKKSDGSIDWQLYDIFLYQHSETKQWIML